MAIGTTAAIITAGVLGAAGGVAGGAAQSKAAKTAAAQQQQAFRDQVRLASPAIQSQRNALVAIADLMGIPRPVFEGGGQDRTGGLLDRLRASPFSTGGIEGLIPPTQVPGQTNPLDALRSTPGFQFRTDQANKAFESSAAARGGLLSGGAIRGQADLNQNLATQEFGNRLNQLFTLAGLGQAGVSGVSNAAATQGNNLSQLQLQQGDNRASTFGNVTNSLLGVLGGLGGVGGGGAGALPTGGFTRLFG